MLSIPKLVCYQVLKAILRNDSGLFAYEKSEINYIANIVIACYYEFAKVAKHFIKFVERGKYESVDFSRRIRNEIGSYNG